MRQLFVFIYKYRAFFVFLLFEGLSSFLIIQNQNYHKAAFLNSSNTLVGNVVNASTNISDYFSLRSQNETLSQEIARLNERISELEGSLPEAEEVVSKGDSQFQYIPAKVVNNSFRLLNNYITLNKGTNDGVKPNQGVINEQGVVGKIRSSSSNFSMVVSLLHTDFLISSVLKRSGTFCTTNWDGRDPKYANLLYVPRHVFVTKGDTVTTSGYNSIFPANQPVGVVEEVSTTQNANFHDIRIKLITDFSQVKFVSIVDFELAAEKDSLEQEAEIIN